MVSWQESALTATTSSSQRSVLITTKRMEDAQYTNVSILRLIWVGATRHQFTQNEHFFRNRATFPWQRGTNSETNETKARSRRAIIIDLFLCITGFAYDWLEIVNKLFNMSPNKLDDRCRNNATSVSWLVCLFCKVTHHRDHVNCRGRPFLRRISHSPCKWWR